MTVLDTKFRSLATKLIAKHGKSVIYSTVYTGSYNVSDGSVVNDEITSTVKALIEDYGSSEMTKGLILANDKKFVIAAESVTSPKKGDKITIENDDYTVINDTITTRSMVYSVVNVKEIWSGEKVAAYEIQGRS